jgi:hypothetical protein
MKSQMFLVISSFIESKVIRDMTPLTPKKTLA